MKPEYFIHSLSQLASLYGEASEPSIKKETSYIHPLYQKWIEASPFAVLATRNEKNMDVSPRGDTAGFIQVEDEHTLLLPERRGNNRIDSLKNIIADPCVALLFLIPNVGEALRVNGRATISVDPELLQRFQVSGALPKCVIVIKVERVLFQCARAIYRSKLWESQNLTADVPTPGQILDAITQHEIDGNAYDNGLTERQKSTLY